MALYSNFLRLNNAVATGTNLLTDRLHVNRPLVDGYLELTGSTSGSVNLQAAATTTPYTFTFPADGGIAGQFLQTDGSGGVTWQYVSLTPTLDEVYGNDADGSNAVINTNPTDGSVEIAGTESLLVTATNGLVISTSGSGGLQASVTGVSPRHLFTPDNADNDSAATETLYIATGDKTDGTGNSGDIVLETGSSAGGNQGRLILNVPSAGSTDVDDDALPTKDVTIRTGNNEGVAGTGSLNLYTGDQVDSTSNNSGYVSLGSGSVLGGSAGFSGDVAMFSGNVFTSTGNTGGARLFSGDTFAGGSTGQVSVNSGNTQAGGDSGSLSISTGFTIGGSGNSGDLGILTGTPDTGNSGNLTIQTGSPTTSGLVGELSIVGGVSPSAAGGNINVLAGQGNTNGGAVNIAGGQGATDGGSINLSAGTGSSGLGGDIALQAGGGVNDASEGKIYLGSRTIVLSSTFSTPGPAPDTVLRPEPFSANISLVPGNMYFGTGNRTGTGTGDSGDLILVTGDRAGGSGNSGDIVLRTGTATATRGSVVVDSTFVVKTNLLPGVSDGYDLGTSSLLWNEAYLGTGVKIATNGGVENIAGSSTLNVGSSGNTSILNLGTGSNTNTINVGTGSGVTTINLGGAGDTVNIAGTLTYVNTTNLEVTDKTIVVNKSGAAASGDDAGIEIEENALITGYAKIANSRASWDFVAPATDGTIRLTPTVNPFIANIDGYMLTDNRTYALPDQSGILALQGSLTVDLETEVTGILPLANGGTATNLSTATPGSLIYVDSTPALNFSAVGTFGQPLISGGTGSPGWFTDGIAGEVVKSLGGVLSTGPVDLTTEVGSSILPLANGGTNKNMTAVNGGIVWTDADSMEVTSAGTAGQPLLSGGAGTPTWFSSTGVVKSTSGVLSTSNVSLTTEVTGTLPLANGGTNKSMTPIAGGVVWTDADSMEVTSAGTSEQVLKSNGTSAPSFGDPDKLFVTLTNNTGSTITAGRVVILSQSTAGEIQLADASAITTCEGVVGVVQSNILDSASGRVQIAGRCTPVQDATFDLGKRVYVSETSGSSTSTAPSSVGTVIFVLGYAVSTTDVILNMRLEAVN